MGRFLLGKIGQYAVVLWIAVTLNFALPRLMPGNPLALLAGEEVGMLTASQRTELMANVGLDQPLPAQYLRYVQNLLRGDLGYSFQKNKPITTILADRLPWTLLLTVTSLLISTVIGVTLGAAAAWQRGGRRDVGLLGFFVFLESLPSFWVGMLLVALFAVQFPIFPTFGALTPWTSLEGMAWVQDVLRHLVLPLTTLTIVSVSGTFIVARYSMLAVLGEDYINVARSKGLRERAILFRHALRNALLPIATVFTLNLAFAFGGATVVETVFSYPGVGRLVYEAVMNRDYPVLQAAFLMITVIVVIANILADAVYPFLDPRVQHAAVRGRDAMIWTSLKRNPLGLVGLVLLFAMLVMALGANWIAPYDPTKQTGKPFDPPSAAHWLGTNDIGQDIVSELIYGARISLLIGVLAAAIAMVIGTGVGLLAGYYRGVAGMVLMRFVDVVLVIPFVPLMVLLAAYLGQNLWNLIVVIGLLIWARPARVIRSQVLSLAEREYVTAARAAGARDGYILFKHILPGVLSLALAQFVLATSSSILIEASLSFLGLGDPTQKSWGAVLFYAQARNAFLSGAWVWWVIPPGLMITASVLGFALLGFALEEALNPRLKARVATASWRKPAAPEQGKQVQAPAAQGAQP